MAGKSLAVFAGVFDHRHNSDAPAGPHAGADSDFARSIRPTRDTVAFASAGEFNPNRRESRASFEFVSISVSDNPKPRAGKIAVLRPHDFFQGKPFRAVPKLDSNAPGVPIMKGTHQRGMNPKPQTNSCDRLFDAATGPGRWGGIIKTNEGAKTHNSTKHETTDP